jgi:flavin reductase (DIM6/NTAB) family NADH-FMN oxidoreductase RutF
MLTSHNPPMMAFSIGITRYSLEVIRHAGECVIAFPGENQAEETVFFGTHSGRDVDKLLQSKVKTVPAYTIDCVLLNDAVANFECKVVSEIQTGDHVIFVAEIVKSHINPDEKNRLYTVAKGFKMSGIRIHSS